MAEARNTRELVEALSDSDDDEEFFPLNDLPNDVLVSVFAAVKNQTWVRHTFPRVCKAWNELYCSENASPLHETLEVDFKKEAKAAERGEWEDEDDEDEDDDDDDDDEVLAVDASRVIAWAERRAGSVRKLRIVRKKDVREDLLLDEFSSEDFGFSSEDLGELVDVVGPSLTDIFIGPNLSELCDEQSPFWESLRDSVVPFGRLRSLVVKGIEPALPESDVEPLAQLAGSLEELVLETVNYDDPRMGYDAGLPRFPEAFFALKELRRLVLVGHRNVEEIPTGISSLKKLEDLVIDCEVSSLPKELGELSGLTKLELSSFTGEMRRRGTPVDEAFPAELGKMKSLRELGLHHCALRAVPAFIGELKSLENLNLSWNRLSSLPKELGELSGLTKLDLSYNKKLEALPAELGKMKSLRELDLDHCRFLAISASVGELRSLESLKLSWNRLSSLPKELGELKSLEVLDLYRNNDLQVDAPLDFLLEGCPRLREVRLDKDYYGKVRWTPESLAHLEAFKAMLRAKNPRAKVTS